MQHREVEGLTSDNKSYFVDTTVQFSEEERAIIQMRGLAGQKAAAGYRSKIPSDAALVLPAWLRALAPLGVALAALVGIFMSTPLGFLLFFAAAGGWAYGYIAPILHANAIKEHIVEIRHVMNNPAFSFYAETPAHAKILASQILEQLTDLKQLISQSAELGAKQTFEL
jgi:hypothetical protein